LKAGQGGPGWPTAPSVIDRRLSWRPFSVSWRLPVLALSACLATVVWRGAYAQTITSLANTGRAAQFVFDGLTFSVSGCTAALCADVELEAVSSIGGATIEVLGNGRGSNGSNIFVDANGSGTDLLAFTLTVSGLGKTRISSVTTAVSGSYPNGGGHDIGSYLAISGPGTCRTTGGFDLGTGCAPLAMGGNPASTTFGPVSNLSISYNLAAGAMAGQTIILSNATQIFSPAPEPSAITLMVTGTAGLAVALVWRKRRRRLSAGFWLRDHIAGQTTAQPPTARSAAAPSTASPSE
jgi:hypothetical protein